MKKVEIISRKKKDDEKTVSSLNLKPTERMINMFKLMELSFYLREGKGVISTHSSKSNIIDIKLVNGTK
jgi:hypothetical protein